MNNLQNIDLVHDFHRLNQIYSHSIVEKKLNKSDESEIISIVKNSIELSNKAKYLIESETSREIIKSLQLVINNCEILKRQNEEALKIFRKKIVISDNQKSSRIVNLPISSTAFRAKELKPGLFERFVQGLKKLVPNFIKKQIDSAYGNLYGGYGRNLRNEQSKQKLNHLLNKQALISKDIDKLSKKQHDIELGYHKSKNKKSFNKQMNSNSKKMSELLKLYNTLEKEIIKTVDSLEKSELLVEKGDDVRNAFCTIGGERIELTTSDEVKLDGVYLDAKKFQEKLKTSGAKKAQITRKYDDGTEIKVDCLQFDRNNKNSVIEALKLLKAFTYFGDSPTEENPIEVGSGWCQVEDGDHIYLIRDEYINETMFLDENEDLQENKIVHIEHQGSSVVLKFTGDTNSTTYLDVNEIEINNESHAGSVILTSGNEGIYEMHKQEAMAFLFRGMNVMLFNFRGYGLSEGIPSQEGFYRDIHAAYECVKEKSGQPDNKILFKGLCFSGGVAAYMSALHPETNVFLDQTYSSLKELIRDPNIVELVPGNMAKTLKKYLDTNLENLKKDSAIEKLKKYIVRTLSSEIQYLFSFLIPNFKVDEYLAKNKGYKAILYIQKDKVINEKHVINNIEELYKKNGLHKLNLFSNFGNHGSSWFKLHNDPDTFLHITNEVADKAKIESQNLDDIGNLLTEIYLEEIESRQKIVDETEAQVQTDQTKLSVLKNEIEAITTKANNVIGLIRDESVLVREKAQKDISKIIKDYERNITKKTFTGRSQMDLFLNRAELSNDILKIHNGKNKINA